MEGFYIAHINHYPIRIKPDDIWLLIVQAFSNHVNANSEKLRKYFVNFDGKKELEVSYLGKNFFHNKKKHLIDFSEQINNKMKEFLGEEILDILTPNFTTSNYDSSIICKLSIMGAFKKYFDYTMNICGCGIPYIILEGTSEDYKKIMSKAKELSKYQFEWYINRIIPHIQKMIDAKEGKIDIDFFKNIIQKKEIIENIYKPSGFKPTEAKVDYISGWFLSFFAYLNIKDYNGNIKTFTSDSIKVKNFKKLANQMLIVPFKMKIEIPSQVKLMKYKVGFIGCDKNEKNEVYPVQGWIVSESTEEDRNSIL